MGQLDRSEEVVSGLPTPIQEPSAGAAARGAGSVWAIRDFRIVALGEGISSVGDAISFTALPLLVLALTGSGAAMGLVAALQTLPDLILGLVVGALADRLDRRRMMLYADAGRAVLTALIPLSVVVGVPTMAVILLVVFPINALRVVFLGAWTGAVPNLVGRDLIGPASSYFEAIFSFGFVLGPGVAGILVSLIGPAPTLAFDAISFIASAAALRLVRTPLQAIENPPEMHLFDEIRDGIRFVLAQSTLRIAVLFWAAFCITTAGFIPALTYFTTHDLRLGPQTLGLLIAVFSVGTLLGALAAARLTHGNLGYLLLGGGFTVGALLSTMSLTGNPTVMAVAAFGAGLGQSFTLVSYVTVRASATPDELLGRVGATTRMVSVGLEPLGAATAGILLDSVAGAATMRVMGGALVVAAALGLLSPVLRRARAVRGAVV